MSDTRRWYQHRRFIARSDRYHNKKLHINKSIRLKLGRENCHYAQYMNVPEKLDLKYFVHPECYKKFVQGPRHEPMFTFTCYLLLQTNNLRKFASYTETRAHQDLMVYLLYRF